MSIYGRTNWEFTGMQAQLDALVAQQCLGYPVESGFFPKVGS